jgi:hypothetical protein
MAFNFIRAWLETIFLSPYRLLRALLPTSAYPTNPKAKGVRERMPKYYHDDEAWADIEPLPQDDGGLHPLAAIAYTEEYSEAMGYLRAVMAKNEFSERVLGLTEHIISMNPAHYTVWYVVCSVKLRSFGGDTAYQQSHWELSNTHPANPPQALPRQNHLRDWSITEGRNRMAQPDRTQAPQELPDLAPSTHHHRRARLM